jgi:hypothetical protein
MAVRHSAAHKPKAQAKEADVLRLRLRLVRQDRARGYGSILLKAD